MNPSRPRLSALDALRGFAALGVCWFHFTQRPDFLPAGLVKSSGTCGWLGVEIFFVISGFTIPYSLWQGGYKLSNYGTFILKRITRLEPPYLVSILFIIGVSYAGMATPGFRGPPFGFTWVQVAAHLGYLNTYLGYPSLNIVFWTLAVELQYYLLAGLLFSVIIQRFVAVRAFTFACLGVLAFSITPDRFLFHWLFLFMTGMTVFQFHVRMLDFRRFFLWVVLLNFGAWYVNGFAVALVTFATALLLGLVRTRHNHPLLFFGRISYSLYLLHVPIGNRVINLCLRFDDTTTGHFKALGAAMAASIVAAWLLYRYVERPAQRWSSAIHYRERQVVGAGETSRALLEKNEESREEQKMGLPAYLQSTDKLLP